MKRSLVLCLLLPAAASRASDLAIEDVRWARADGVPDEARITVAWSNAWHDDRNHDGAWVHLRYTGTGQMNPYSLPARIAHGGHQVLSGTAGVSVSPSADRVGIWLVPPEGHRGEVRCELGIRLDDEGRTDPVIDMDGRTLTAHAAEMVLVPAGAYWLGDPDPRALDNGAFHLVGSHDRPPAPFRVEHERVPIMVGEDIGSLSYEPGEHGYRGDGKGPIPADFPKGVAAIWIMKYELTQGQYAGFLNTLHPEATCVRSNIGGRDYGRYGGSIVCEDGAYRALEPDRACAFVTWDDLCAFADWAGLRPMTELEFEKACRGPRVPQPMEYPWNTSSRERLKRQLDPQRARTYADGLAEAQMSEENRDQFGASFYRVFDLAGNVWERCITVGDSAGRAFKGTHGDGVLGAWASATNADWPTGSTMAPGLGYRGGAYYDADEPHGMANPYSPIGYRTYAGWGGAYRYKTYSARFVRTVE
jgi:formylglycine-generating enzyme required for sulfatase activity